MAFNDILLALSQVHSDLRTLFTLVWMFFRLLFAYKRLVSSKSDEQLSDRLRCVDRLYRSKIIVDPTQIPGEHHISLILFLSENRLQIHTDIDLTNKI